MNRQIRRLGLVLLLCFGALFVRLNFLQVFDAEELAENPLNTRRVVEDFGEARGDVLTADGVLVATSIEVGGQLKRERNYPEGELYAPITGYFGFNVGATGIESQYNAELAGRKNSVPMTRLFDLLGSPDKRADVQLTIFSEVQQAARDALGDRVGSVVALDPQSGEVLALWNWPSYDPNLVSTNDLEAATEARVALDAATGNPLRARSYRDALFPGSTFKVITAAAGLENQLLTSTDPVFPSVDEYTAPLTTAPIRNFGGSSCGGDLGAILRSSCNTAFAYIAAEVLGPERLTATANRFGFNDTPPIDLPAAVPSQFPEDYGAELSESSYDPPAPIVEDTPLLAQAAIGQYDVKASPLHMALVAAAIANEGEMMAPHVVREVRESDTRNVIHDAERDVWKTPLSANDARTLRELMVGIVTDGTASQAAIGGFEVGAKTGTAQTTISEGRADDTHAWMIAFAGPPGVQPTVAVAVVVEAVPGGGQQTGGTVAAPIARSVLEAALNVTQNGG